MPDRSRLYFENPARQGTWGWLLEDADRQLRAYDRVLADPASSADEKTITMAARSHWTEARAEFQRMVDRHGYDAPFSGAPAKGSNCR